MAKSKHKRTPKTVLKLPDLEQSKSVVMNSLTSASSKRSSSVTIISYRQYGNNLHFFRSVPTNALRGKGAITRTVTSNSE
jgi:hypothetical protein